MEQLDESSLGRERGEFATPGSPLERQLAQCAQPEAAGWYVDPLLATRARKFNGTNWTGLTRDLIEPDTAAPVARTVAAPDPAAPLLIGNCEFEQADGIAVPGIVCAGVEPEGHP